MPSIYLSTRQPGMIGVYDGQTNLMHAAIMRTKSQFTKGVVRPYVARALATDEPWMAEVNALPVDEYEKVRDATVAVFAKHGYTLENNKGKK